MPIYRYKAVNAAGDVATGELDAANESEIVERLRDQGMLPMQVARATGEVAGAGAASARGAPRAAPLVRVEKRQSRSAAGAHPRARDAAATPACRSTARWRS